ncbi:glycine-rich domain-containing protein [Thalassomonas actiniarum]|uniref:Uncharacterized protein n=1 Tax=Thalassomonas actiniarum TaxID=485447 RepID=A0AAF0C5L2_9GAMM|nr:hypothetical protein [Thalassomonas actiniarum]WDE01678.1 hypothetical protein SG35_014235 [Thalassomonas actiniarum]
MELVFYIIVICLLVTAAGLFYFKARAKRRMSYINSYQFPDAVSKKVAQTYPHLNDGELAQVIKGLREYFHLNNLAAGKMIAMPSQVIDVAWHEFILFTRNYQTFCKHAFGRFLHHTPAEAMQSQVIAQAGIKHIWRLACLRETINPRSPKKLPLVFALDARLKIEDGFSYELNCMRSGVVSSGSYKGAHTSQSSGAAFCVTHIGCSSDTGFGGGGCSGGSGDSGGLGCGGGGSSCGGGGD